MVTPACKSLILLMYALDHATRLSLIQPSGEILGAVSNPFKPAGNCGDFRTNQWAAGALPQQIAQCLLWDDLAHGRPATVLARAACNQ
jgi:hypothetical protein